MVKVSLFTVCDYYDDVHTDPASFYEEQIELAKWAEELNYDAFFVAEHHFHPYGLVPDAALMLTAVARETERINLGPAICTLPFHNPVRAAEQYAMLDQLSKGRLVLGVGSGYLAHEFEGFNMTPANKRQIFDEALEVMEKGMTGKKFKHSGDYFTVPKTKLNVSTYGGREVTPKIAILTELAAYHVGRRGYGIMTVPYATVDTIDDAVPMFENYRKGWAENGKPGEGEVFAAVHTHCTTDAGPADNKVNRDHLEKYVYSRLYAKHSDYDECLTRRVIATGRPSDVTEQLQRVIDTGVNHLKLIVNYGAMPRDEVRGTLELVANEVRPNLVEFEHAVA
ncbi:LLM class flavin-dependent oxidoreductase [bacterium]|nr:LLM class flavin-dependent oxidoreductase [bacterium]